MWLFIAGRGGGGLLLHMGAVEPPGPMILLALLHLAKEQNVTQHSLI